MMLADKLKNIKDNKEKLILILKTLVSTQIINADTYNILHPFIVAMEANIPNSQDVFADLAEYHLKPSTMPSQSAARIDNVLTSLSHINLKGKNYQIILKEI